MILYGNLKSTLVSPVTRLLIFCCCLLVASAVPGAQPKGRVVLLEEDFETYSDISSLKAFLGNGSGILETNAPGGGNTKPARDSGKPTASDSGKPAANDNSRPRSSHQSLGDFGTSGNADARGNANAWGNVDSRHVQAGGDASASTSADASMNASTPR